MPQFALYKTSAKQRRCAVAAFILYPDRGGIVRQVPFGNAVSLIRFGRERKCLSLPSLFFFAEICCATTLPNFEANVVHRPARWSFSCAVLILCLTALLACAVPPAPLRNPFIGTWATSDNDTISIRQDTVVQHQSDGQNIPLDRQTCNGTFSFSYTVQTREALTGLLPRQPDLDKNLSTLLSAPTYPVAQLRCDRGDHTYVLLNDHALVVIYRDGDIGVVQRLARR